MIGHHVGIVDTREENETDFWQSANFATFWLARRLAGCFLTHGISHEIDFFFNPVEPKEVTPSQL